MTIKAKKADLQMIHFAVSRLEMNWISPSKDKAVDEVDYNDLEVLIDFDRFQKPEQDEEFLFVMHIEVNPQNSSRTGYQLRVSGNGVFKIADPESKSAELLYNLRFISPATLMLNTLRAALSDVTSYGINGRYNLPAIDILQLIKDKAALEVKKKKKSLKK